MQVHPYLENMAHYLTVTVFTTPCVFIFWWECGEAVEAFFKERGVRVDPPSKASILPLTTN